MGGGLLKMGDGNHDSKSLLSVLLKWSHIAGGSFIAEVLNDTVINILRDIRHLYIPTGKPQTVLTLSMP